MKKRIVALMLVGVMALAGCQSAAESEGGAAADTSQTAISEAAASEAASETSGDELNNSDIEDIEPLDLSRFVEKEDPDSYIPADVNTSGEKEDGTPWKIAWCNSDMSDESMAYMSFVMEDAAEKYGFELVSFDSQSDPQKQVDNINSAISQGCDAIIINPNDPTGLVPAMKKAREEGLVVINCQNAVVDPDAYDCYQGPDDTFAGQMAATSLMEALPDGGKIVMIDGMAGTTCQINRTKGFRGVLQSHPEYEILEEQATPWSTEQAIAIMESYLSKYPEIDGVFGQYDLATLAVQQAAKDVGRDEEMVFVSVDGQQDALDEIATGGSFISTAMQDFTLNSELQCLVALGFLNGDGDKIGHDVISYDVHITKDNANNFEAGW